MRRSRILGRRTDLPPNESEGAIPQGAPMNKNFLEELKVEVKKAFRSAGFWLSVLFGTVICVLQTIWVFKNIYQPNNEQLEYIQALDPLDEKYGSWYETGILQGWIGCEGFSAYNEILFLALPLLAVLPYGISLFSECRSGYAAQMLVRCGRKRYITAKACATFVSGGTAADFPLLISLLASACYLPAIGVDPLSMKSIIAARMMWSGLYFEHPVGYAFLYSLVVFVYGGIYALVSMLCSAWFENRFGILIFPLLLHGMLYFGIQSLAADFGAYNPSVFINPIQPYTTNTVSGILIATAVLLAAETSLLFLTHRRRDYI